MPETQLTTSTAERMISDSDLEIYRRDGVVCLRGAFADWVEPLQRGLAANIAEPGPFRCESTTEGEPGRFFDDYCNWERIPEYRDHVLHSGAAALAGRTMGARQAQFFHEHVFVKEPGTVKATPWHHDMPYYCVEGAQTVSIYVALDPMPEESSVVFAAGSHRWGKLFYPRHFVDGRNFEHDDTRLAEVPDIWAEEAAYDLRVWALEPGDAVLFDFLTLHGSRDATVKAPRRSFATRWLGEDVTFFERPGDTSPPYPGIGLKTGDPMREDWFPIVWRAEH